eukprot:GDKH01008254.1.p3 GENE.GDKH01008254.1~~GDKH01008254.1.p3  ORF type:complete len:136 (-),score=1.81 GDKH01008254.1:225-632(-)
MSDSSVLTFGKYKFVEFGTVFHVDPGYIVFCRESCPNPCASMRQFLDYVEGIEPWAATVARAREQREVIEASRKRARRSQVEQPEPGVALAACKRGKRKGQCNPDAVARDRGAKRAKESAMDDVVVLAHHVPIYV